MHPNGVILDFSSGAKTWKINLKLILRAILSLSCCHFIAKNYEKN